MHGAVASPVPAASAFARRDRGWVAMHAQAGGGPTAHSLHRDASSAHGGGRGSAAPRRTAAARPLRPTAPQQPAGRANMQRTMKAAVVRKFGAPLTIEDVPVPVPGVGQVLVAIVA